jgi:hypothetical protein
MTTIYATNRTISNYDDTLDSSDIIVALQDLKDLAFEEFCEAESIDSDEATEEPSEKWLMENFSEYDMLVILTDLCAEGEGFADWNHGEMLIHDSYFSTYAQELAEDVCDMSNAVDWPFRHIDWKAAAEELQMDYSQIDFDGQAYWIRS